MRSISEHEHFSFSTSANMNQSIESRNCSTEDYMCTFQQGTTDANKTESVKLKSQDSLLGSWCTNINPTPAFGVSNTKIYLCPSHDCCSSLCIYPQP